jgi:hypothetical protein
VYLGQFSLFNKFKQNVVWISEKRYFDGIFFFIENHISKFQSELHSLLLKFLDPSFDILNFKTDMPIKSSLIRIYSILIRFKLRELKPF